MKSFHVLNHLLLLLTIANHWSLLLANTPYSARKSIIAKKRLGSALHSMSKRDTAISASKTMDMIPKDPLYMKILPIYPTEFVKFATLSLMMFFIVLVFTMTRDTKDILIITNCGAESIAFLKVYGVIPAATLFMVLYSKLSNNFSPWILFNIVIAPFFVFYTVFAFILYPLRNVLHPLSIIAPDNGFSYAVNILRHWTFALYYIVSELWGSAGIPLLFWSCVNDVIKVNQAKRIYPLISMVGNLGPILSGLLTTMVGQYVSARIPKTDERSFEMSLQLMTVIMNVAGGLVLTLHWYIHRIVEKERGDVTKKEDDIKPKSENDSIAKKKKPSLSFVESLKVLSSNPYLRDIAVMVLSYGLTMEFTEIIWKSTVKKAFPNKMDYQNFYGKYTTLTGMASFIMMLVGSNTVNALGWKAGALITPVMMGLLGLPFFLAIMNGGISSQKALLYAVYIGLIQNVVSKGSKYAVFDPTKEMTYIPLDQDSKTKGKAAIDVLGARLGKSGAAFIQQLLVVMAGNILNGAPVIAAMFYVVIFAWIGAVNDLAPRFEALSMPKGNPVPTEKKSNRVFGLIHWILRGLRIKSSTD